MALLNFVFAMILWFNKEEFWNIKNIYNIVYITADIKVIGRSIMM